MKSLLIALRLIVFISPLTSAQTLPPDPEAEITHLSGDYYALMWHGHAGNTYFIQTTTGELTNGSLIWEYIPDIRFGIDQPLGMGFESLGDPNKRFYRLQYTNQPVVIDHNLDDNDGDGWTNLEEVQANTDPENSQSYPTSNGGSGGGSSNEGEASGLNDEEVIIVHIIDDEKVTYTFSKEDKTPPFSIDLSIGIVNKVIIVKSPDDYELQYLRITPNGDYDPNASANSSESSKYFVVYTQLKKNVVWSYTGTEPYSNVMGKLSPIAVVPDYNRDGKITSSDRHQINEDNPWRWWVNDDKDLIGEEIKDLGKDIPGQGPPNYSNHAVDGLRDLVDFFPLHLQIKWVIEELPPSEYKYSLKHGAGALKYYEEIETVLDADENNQGPAAYLRNLNKAKTVKGRLLKQTIGNGTQLGAGILAASYNGMGVLICEAAGETDAPLILEIKENDGTSVVEIPFWIKFREVEKMFRHGNMRSTAGGSGGPDSRLGNPGDAYPDELTNGKYFVFLHGFNVGPDAARGWHAEIFKRLHQLGSRNRFTGISWHGDVAPDYHEGVHNAFKTSKALPAWLQVGGAEITIAAHSLGNMVVSNAIEHEDHNGTSFTPKNYFMINGATPIEAYDANQQNGIDPETLNPVLMAPRMTENSWKPYYNDRNKLFASNWHKLFDAPDGREKLKWPDRFGNRVPQLAYNFYSTGEDVVENADVSESVLSASIKVLIDLGRHAWIQQEIAKGSEAMRGNGILSTHAGWRFSKGYGREEWTGNTGRHIYLTPQQASALTPEQLKSKPFHHPFKFEKLYKANEGSAEGYKKEVQHELLSGAIPAMSFAVAANPVDKLTEARNFNMMDMKNDGWPRASGDWIHSDFRDVAFSYVMPMYQEMIDQGGLDNE